MLFEEQKVLEALDRAWSLETAKQWSAENPANGQCNVTAAVIQEIFGGDILKTEIPPVWHYYNQINGKAYDLTASQFTRPNARFPAPNPYEDRPSNLAEAMNGIPQREYDTLKTALLKELF